MTNNKKNELDQPRSSTLSFPAGHISIDIFIINSFFLHETCKKKKKRNKIIKDWWKSEL
jgi:hypothetical protein